ESLAEIEKEIGELELKEKYLEYLENYIKGSNPFDQIVSPSVVGLNEQTLNELIKGMTELYIKRKTLQSSYQPSNPILKEVEMGLLNLQLTALETVKSLKRTVQIA
ncbi:hypothetical protein, partial [Umezakia ovalisporum]|uniref:hypothetical protein n=1 Tax=Umezakia ovalisporum TaxID=75695 RepID=UPI0039C6A791